MGASTSPPRRSKKLSRRWSPATFWNPRIVAGLKTTVLPCSGRSLFRIERPRFFLLRMAPEGVQSPIDRIRIRLGNQTRRGRIDEALNFWRRWFSNRRISSVFATVTDIRHQSAWDNFDDRRIETDRSRRLETSADY